VSRTQPNSLGLGRVETDISGRSPSIYGEPVDRMPEPGDLITAFSPQPGRCFRMVYSHQLQADHCRQPLAWKGQWQDVKGHWWYVEACRQHAPKVTSVAPEGF
jgi:hypothetical protein